LRNAIISPAQAAACAVLLAAVAPAAPDNTRTVGQDNAHVKGLLAAAGVPCNVSAVLKIDTAPAPAPTAGKRARQTNPALPERYEVSCQQGLGYIVAAAADRDSKPTASYCFEHTELAPPAICILPGNHTDAQRSAVAALLARSGRSDCELDRYRFAGRSVAQTFFEVACRNADGYVLAGSNPFDPAKKLEAVPCMSLAAASDYACRLTDPGTAIDAMTTAAEAQFNRESGRTQCKVQGRRHMLTDAGGNGWYEFMCQDGANYIMARLANGKFGGTDACSAAVVAELGGCQLPKPAGK
jgi:hypothetical protein